MLVGWDRYVPFSHWTSEVVGSYIETLWILRNTLAWQQLSCPRTPQTTMEHNSDCCRMALFKKYWFSGFF